MVSKDPREAAYLAALSSFREEGYASDWLDDWRNRCSPSSADSALARELAYGIIRMHRALDYLAQRLSLRQKLELKLRERLLLYLGIYQKYYMNKIPDHALVYETVNLAKKYCHGYFIKFLNALLRTLIQNPPARPSGDSIRELSLRFSYPEFYVEQLDTQEGLSKAKEIMAIGNTPSKTMLRLRKDHAPEGVQRLIGVEVPMGVVVDPGLLPELACSPDYYFQNATPVVLMAELAKGVQNPKRILDLCAAPGGKLLFLHDNYPKAELIANDSSEKRLVSLEENCRKYGLNATLNGCKGEAFQSDTSFDLIVLDVPCSNSGVLNKRPEARWRLTPGALAQLTLLQKALIKHALTLLAPGGEIWYLTCSILDKENHGLIASASAELGMKIQRERLILPNQNGWDGGYGAALKP